MRRSINKRISKRLDEELINIQKALENVERRPITFVEVTERLAKRLKNVQRFYLTYLLFFSANALIGILGLTSF